MSTKEKVDLGPKTTTKLFKKFVPKDTKNKKKPVPKMKAIKKKS